MPRVVFYVPLLFFLLTPGVQGQEWARKMFSVTSHDFGVVTRGAKTEFDFEFENIYEEDVHIASVHSSCGCTTPTIVNPSLKTWEKGAIRARFNTESFVGHKSATVTVVIDKPFPAEVQLTVSGYIRGDVVISPSDVEFGEIDEGNGAERLVTVSYAGRPTWRIADVQSASTHFAVRLQQTQRTDSRVDYRMVVRLKDDMPSGFFTDQLLIVTNDQANQSIPLTVRGRVVPSLTVSPASLALGVLEPGAEVTKSLVVRAKHPFKIVNLQCDDAGDCLSFKTSEVAKQTHVIPVTYRAGEEPGKFALKIDVETDIGAGLRASCLATVTVKGS
ncbi:MAG: DUF1573 domain-containing protein [Pirellulaceae bacterium]|nr:DUF1573 domain-containing protein [Planctomycetales bacterium]